MLKEKVDMMLGSANGSTNESRLSAVSASMYGARVVKETQTNCSTAGLNAVTYKVCDS